MDGPSGPAWSDQTGAADWIRPRLGPDGPFTVTAVVPAGFAGYARILHPAQGPAPGDRPVRWAEIAAWSGVPLGAGSQFHSVALPQQRPAQPAPWSGSPGQGSLYPPDAVVLMSILRGWTATPDQCWFCLWHGYGYGIGESVTLVAVRDGRDSEGPLDGQSLAEDPAEGAVELPDLFQDPVPEAVRKGPWVKLPDREYLLYTGPVEAAVGAGGPLYAGQSANLWWPQDHTWCVASEIDLPWTYVGGPEALIDELVADQRIEAVRASPRDEVGGLEPWIADAVAAAAEQLFTTGEAAIATSRGTIRAHLDLPSWRRQGMLRIESDDGSDSGRSSTSALGRGTKRDDLRDEIVRQLTFDVIGLTES